MPADARASLAGWEALVDHGGSDEAERLFDRRLRAVPADPVALFGRASIAYERGVPEQAIAGYAAVLSALHARPDDWGPLLAPVAAGRVLALYDEVGVVTRKRIVGELRPSELARAADLPWQARVELARLAAHAAREASDAPSWRGSRRGSAARRRSSTWAVGPLPNIDLDVTPPRRGRPPHRRGGRSSRRVAGWTSRRRPTGVAARGCCESRSRCRGRLSRRARLSRRGARRDRRRRAEAHGAATQYGAHLSAVHVKLPPGRHDLEIRLATRGGVARLALVRAGQR